MKIKSLAELELLEVQQYNTEAKTVPVPVSSPEIKKVEEEEKKPVVATPVVSQKPKPAPPGEKAKELTYVQKVQDRLMEAVRLREERDFKTLSADELVAQHGLLVRGYHKDGYVDSINRPRDLIDFIEKLTTMIEARRVCDFWVYSFRIPEGYTAWTNQASYEQLYAEGKTAQIRSDRKRNIRESKYIKHCSDSYIVQADLEAAQVVTFVLHDQFGLLRWRPGVFVDLLPPAEHCGWVTVEKP